MSRRRSPPPTGGSSAAVGHRGGPAARAAQQPDRRAARPDGGALPRGAAAPGSRDRAHRSRPRSRCSSRSATSSTWSGSKARRGWSSTRTGPGSPAPRRCPRAQVHAGRGRSRRTAGRIARAAKPVHRRRARARGAILWSQSYDGAWSATVERRDAAAPARRSVGRTATRSTSRARSRSRTTNQWVRYPAVLIELALGLRCVLPVAGSARFRWPFRRRPVDEVHREPAHAAASCGSS